MPPPITATCTSDFIAESSSNLSAMSRALMILSINVYGTKRYPPRILASLNPRYAAKFLDRVQSLDDPQV